MSKISLFSIILIAIGFLSLNALFTMNEREQGLVLQFGEPKRVVQSSGLHFKLPLIQNVEQMIERLF